MFYTERHSRNTLLLLLPRPRGPLCWLDPGAFGTLGVGGGFALGAKLCRPDAEVWVIYGDGSLGYSVAEFDTFTRHKVQICLCICCCVYGCWCYGALCVCVCVCVCVHLYCTVSDEVHKKTMSNCSNMKTQPSLQMCVFSTQSYNVTWIIDSCPFVFC